MLSGKPWCFVRTARLQRHTSPVHYAFCMGIFSNKDRKAQSAPEGFVPFTFTVSTVFAIPMRGPALVGTVTDGEMRIGQSAVLLLPSGPIKVTVAKIDKARKKAAFASEGEEAGVFLTGFTTEHIPVAPGQNGSVIDAGAMAGCVLAGH